MQVPSTKIIPLIIISVAAVVTVFILNDKGEEVIIKTEGATFEANIQNIVSQTRSEAQLEAWLKEVKETNTQPTEEAEKLTATDKLSRDFLVRYAEATESGASLDEVIQDSILNSIPEINHKKYTLIDISTSSSEDSESIKSYGNALGSIIYRHSIRSDDNEFYIVMRAIYNEDETELEKLTPIINGYKLILDDFLSLTVPLSAAPHHLELVNNTSRLLEIIKGMKSIFSDPLSAISSVQEYNIHTTVVSDSFNKVAKYFSQKGVTFQQHEDGYMFNLEI